MQRRLLAAIALIALSLSFAAAQTAGEICQLGFSAVGFPVDVTQAGQVDRLVRDAVDRFGRLDILVNNAGVVSNAPVLDLSEDEWDRT